jgi:ribosome biogenesis GTPase
MDGVILKALSGFYYVDVGTGPLIACRARGKFRHQKVVPLVGDRVSITRLDDTTGMVDDIYPRINMFLRPAVANIDQALVVFAVTKPKPHFNLLDRFLIMMESKGIPVILCFNKKDIATEPEIQELKEIYASCGYQIVFTSALEEENVDEVKKLLEGKTTAIAGPSGVGKSSLINILQPEAQMETGSISEKIERGKHTTRHSELIWIEDETYIMDTPGFSSLYTNEFEKEELKYYFTEFEPYEGTCRFQGCDHVHEPGCAVKAALEEGKIHSVRYQNYLEMYQELKDKRRY